MASKHGNYRKKSSIEKKFIAIGILVIIIIAIIFFSKDSKQNNNNFIDNRLINTWTTDGITVYEFYNNGNGTMKLPSSEYKFTYVTNDNKLYINFESDKAIDSDYEYSFDNDKLILKGINATSGTYTFTKK